MVQPQCRSHVTTASAVDALGLPAGVGCCHRQPLQFSGLDDLTGRSPVLQLRGATMSKNGPRRRTRGRPRHVARTNVHGALEFARP
jgi:hypothetical protein